MSEASKPTISPLADLELAHSAARSLQRMSEIVNANGTAQFVHKYRRKEDEKYVVEHVREGCEFCDSYGIVIDAINALLRVSRDRIEEEMV